jgi:hypothetical protein
VDNGDIGNNRWNFPATAIRRRDSDSGCPPRLARWLPIRSPRPTS